MKISLLLIFLASTYSMYAQDDFSGSWKLNVDKSRFNNTPGTPAPANLIVEQKNGNISFQRNERPKETLKIGATAAAEIIEGETKTKVAMKLAEDKRRLIETRTYAYRMDPGAEVAAKKTRTWSLSDDKKNLIIRDQIYSTAGNTYEMMLVYDRQ